MSEYRYPEILQGAAFPSARKMLDTWPPDQRQAVLDEIGAMQAPGKVRRPLGLLKALTREAVMGQFFSNHSVSNTPRSTGKTQGDGKVAYSLPTTQLASRSPSPVSEIGRETLARLRKQLRTGSS